MRCKAVASPAFGVGHNPDPIPEVRGANVGSWYAVPFRIVPDLGQVTENASEPSPLPALEETNDVLHNCKLRLYLANKPTVFVPKPRPFSAKLPRTCPNHRINAFPVPLRRYVLAREPTTDDFDLPNVFTSQFSYIIVNRNQRPMFLEDRLTEWIDLTECNSLHSSLLKPKTESANA